MTNVPPPHQLLGIPIHPVSADELVDLLVEWGRGATLRRVFNVNVHAMNLAHEDAAFAAALRAADIVFCDGYGVKWGARLAGMHIPHRLTPPDWVDHFAGRVAAAGQSVFALGDEDGVAARFQQTLGERHRGYRDAGSAHGFFSRQGRENDTIVEAINASHATHLLVGMGMPAQELWATANAARLRVRTVISVGALYRWVTRIDTRAPRWVTDNGLEWAARLARHPVRHFKRYVIGNPRFLARVIRARMQS